MAYELPPLPYDYSDLEPVISAEIMQLHHTKHHATYVTGLNVALEKYHAAEEKKDLGAMIALQTAIRFHGGGHTNHSIFWNHLLPPKKFTPPEGILLEAIKESFGSLDGLIATLSAQSIAIQGSGWGWLGIEPTTGKLRTATTANQDPLTTQGLLPLMGIDVWEHAYYLQYKNLRAEYVKNIWGIIDWKHLSERFKTAIPKK